jgi:hypothetical protein
VYDPITSLGGFTGGPTSFGVLLRVELRPVRARIRYPYKTQYPRPFIIPGGGFHKVIFNSIIPMALIDISIAILNNIVDGLIIIKIKTFKGIINLQADVP